MIRYSEEVWNNGGFKTLLGKIHLSDIARDIDFSFIKCPRREYQARTKRDLAIKIFLDFMKIVVKDIVYNHTIFRLPTYKHSFMFVGDDWSDRESYTKPRNIFSFSNPKVLQIAVKHKRSIYNKMCIVQKDEYNYIQDNLKKYNVDPTLALE